MENWEEKEMFDRVTYTRGSTKCETRRHVPYLSLLPCCDSIFFIWFLEMFLSHSPDHCT